jgi:hypothetical protein
MFHFAQHYSRDMDDYHVRINLALNFPFSSILNQNTKHFQLTCIARFPHFTEFFLSKQMLSILRIVQLFHSTVHIAGWLLDLEVWSLQVFLSSLWSNIIGPTWLFLSGMQDELWRGFQIVSSLFGQRYQYLGMRNKATVLPLGGVGWGAAFSFLIVVWFSFLKKYIYIYLEILINCFCIFLTLSSIYYSTVIVW